MRVLKIFHKMVVVSCFLLINTLSALEVKELESQSGISFWFHQDTSVEIVSLSFALKHSGSAYIDGALNGLLSTYADMLMEGTENDDAFSFRKKLAENAIQIDFRSDGDSFRGNFSSSKKTLKEAKTLFKDALYQATFDENRLNLYKTRELAGLENAMKTPGYLLGRLVSQGLFGTHPYGEVPHLTPESAKLITPMVLKNLRARLYNRANLYIVVSGNLSESEAKAFVDHLFKDFPNQPGRDGFKNVPVLLNQDINLKNAPYPQSLVSFFVKGLSPQDPDLMKFQIALDIFGGGLGSRIGDSVREKAGLVYSIRANPQFMDGAHFLSGQFGSTDENVTKAIGLVALEFEKFVKFGVTKQELEDSKSKQIGNSLLAMSSTANIAARLLFLKMNNFPANYFDKRTEIINAITVADVNQMLKKLYSDKKLTFFVLGNPAKTEASS